MEETTFDSKQGRSRRRLKLLVKNNGLLVEVPPDRPVLPRGSTPNIFEEASLKSSSFQLLKSQTPIGGWQLFNSFKRTTFSSTNSNCEEPPKKCLANKRRWTKSTGKSLFRAQSAGKFENQCFKSHGALKIAGEKEGLKGTGSNQHVKFFQDHEKGYLQKITLAEQRQQRMTASARLGNAYFGMLLRNQLDQLPKQQHCMFVLPPQPPRNFRRTCHLQTFSKPPLSKHNNFLSSRPYLQVCGTSAVPP